MRRHTRNAQNGGNRIRQKEKENAYFGQNATNDKQKA